MRKYLPLIKCPVKLACITQDSHLHFHRERVFLSKDGLGDRRHRSGLTFIVSASSTRKITSICEELKRLCTHRRVKVPWSIYQSRFARSTCRHGHPPGSPVLLSMSSGSTPYLRISHIGLTFHTSLAASRYSSSPRTHSRCDSGMLHLLELLIQQRNNGKKEKLERKSRRKKEYKKEREHALSSHTS